MSKEKIMIMKQNPDTKNWLCHIPDNPQAYYYKRKKDAEKFCNIVNEAFATGELYFDEDGNVKRVVSLENILKKIEGKQ